MASSQHDEDEEYRHSPYHQHLRQQIVKMHFADGATYGQIAACFAHRPSESTVGRICRAYARDGSTALQGRSGVRCATRRAGGAAKSALLAMVLRVPDGMLHEYAAAMTTQLAEPWDECAVRRALDELGFVRKALTTYSAEASEQQQAAFMRQLDQLRVQSRAYLFIDEVAAVGVPRAGAGRGGCGTLQSLLRGSRATPKHPRLVCSMAHHTLVAPLPPCARPSPRARTRGSATAASASRCAASRLRPRRCFGAACATRSSAPSQRLGSLCGPTSSRAPWTWTSSCGGLRRAW
jgi:transposase